MIELRPFKRLGAFENDWLAARHHFSFSSYHDDTRMNWGALRVWNDDEIQPKTGFAPHGHQDMEIITYVRDGAITHQDSLGNRGRTEAGDVQVMSAGAGVQHSEYNLESDVTRLFQIWILPKTRGGKPYWGAAKFPKTEREGALVALASGYDEDQANGALPIRQDARVLGATLRSGNAIRHVPGEGRNTYLVVARGAVNLNGELLNERDGAAIKDEALLTITAQEDAEIVLVDAP